MFLPYTVYATSIGQFCFPPPQRYSPKDTNITLYSRFDVFAAVTMKNGVFWDVTPCEICKNLRFGGT
jgi:hypothetical protein